MKCEIFLKEKIELFLLFLIMFIVESFLDNMPGEYLLSDLDVERCVKFSVLCVNQSHANALVG